MKRATTLEVSTTKFLNNLKKIKEYVGGKELMPVIKANGYGTNINKKLSVINHFNIVAVAMVEEAIFLRELGYEKEIFVLNQPAVDEIEDIHKYNLIVGVSEKTFIESINVPIRVHLEIETGMNRTGIQLDKIKDYIEMIKKNKNIQVEGTYTHLSSADFDEEYTNNQLDIFKKAVSILKEHFNLKYIHSSASNGLLNYDDGVSNLVRPGIIMYGYESYEGVKNQIDIEPIAKLITHITYLKDIDEGQAISYSQKYKTTKKMKVATIPIGYADGYRRELTNIGEVVVKGKKCKVLGSVCMDSCMIDVTDLDVQVGDEVFVFDNDLVTLESIAEKCHTINYEILSTISYRVPRIFVEEE
ncbi:MAG: alanine racemase [Bacilli bacterium]|nr:alanine racemase [Bacilli bacterium]